MPVEIDAITRQLTQMQIEEQALMKEEDEASKERLVTLRKEIPCPLHWVLQGGDNGMLCVLQNQDGETMSVIRQTDIPVTAAPESEQSDLRGGRMFDDVQALEGYLESLSS